jgi:lipoprotein NlpD
LVLVTLLALAGCGGAPRPASGYQGPPPAVYYVRRGDTLYGIGQRFGVDHRKIARWNGIKDPGSLRLGQRLRLRPPSRRATRSHQRSAQAQPSGGEEASGGDGSVAVVERPRAGKVAVARRDSGTDAGSGETGAEAGTGAAPAGWQWPVAGEVIREFSTGGRDPSNGLDIAAEKGTPVRAAADGQVVYSGNGLRGYGNLVIIRHGGGYLTTYAYNQDNRVAEDDRVSAGDVVARVGATGAAERPSLHFEVRRRTEPIDPREVLPAQR